MKTEEKLWKCVCCENEFHPAEIAIQDQVTCVYCLNTQLNSTISLSKEDIIKKMSYGM